VWRRHGVGEQVVLSPVAESWAVHQVFIALGESMFGEHVVSSTPMRVRCRGREGHLCRESGFGVVIDLS